MILHIPIMGIAAAIGLTVSRPLKNVFEAADTRQKQAKKRSLCGINEHFELVFNTVTATQIVFQRPVSGCTAQQLNSTGQSWQRNECARMLDQWERERCLSNASTPYEAYKKQSGDADTGR
ncbi:hypothetical protein [Nitrosomonas sp.]|uniref:hypothetical protein n=1 Tax=Nitrosomonas sp. TaxID=42353 RepID=UPI0025EBF60B|nr:hypothetical protein [Nitrosomonas sp.]